MNKKYSRRDEWNTAAFHYLRYLIRDNIAVCRDWNSFALVYELKLPAGESLEAAVGRVAPQPYYSDKSPEDWKWIPQFILSGGEYQYIVDLEKNPKNKGYVKLLTPLQWRTYTVA